jgi:hypothetical protein
MEIWSESHVETWLKLFGFIGCVSLFLNGCLLRSFWKERRETKPPELLMINLCISEIIAVFGSYPMAISSFFNHCWSWGTAGEAYKLKPYNIHMQLIARFSNISFPGCWAYGAISFFGGAAEVYSLLAIAVMRYFKICDMKQGKSKSCRISVTNVVFRFFSSCN